MILESDTMDTSITQYWSRTCPEGRRYSHWREACDDFDSISRSIGRLIAEQWPDVLEQRNACWLDWGCGGGAGVVALSRLARFVYGVDISTASLKECEKTHRENMATKI